MSKPMPVKSGTRMTPAERRDLEAAIIFMLIVFGVCGLIAGNVF